MATQFKPGDWCDVVPHPDGYAFVYQQGQTIICEVNGAKVWRVELPEPILYLRAACSPDDGDVVAIGQGNHTGEAIVVNSRGIGYDGPTFGQNCTVVAWERDQFVFYIQRTSSTYSRWPLGEPDAEQPIPIGPTSQGWLDVVNGRMVWTDPNRSKVIDGITLVLAVGRGDTWVGQGVVGPDQITAVLPTGQASTVIKATSWEPHIAALADGRFAVCARTPHGSALALCPPWPAFIRTYPPELPPIPVPPEPPPEPLAVTITDYTEAGVAPLTVVADYMVTGHRGAVDVMLTIDDRIVVSVDAPKGRASHVLTEPGEYRLGVTVVSRGRRAETGAVRIVRVAAPVPQTPEHPGIAMPTAPGSGNPDDARKPWNDAASAAERENQ